MNAKMILSAVMAVAAGAGIPAFADTEAYTLGDTSLANGKITFAYDDSGKITELSMKPDYGETLTLTGDTLSFAAGAQIVGARNGEACIANAITADGVVNFGPARQNFTYSGDFLPSNVVNAVVVAANTSIEDIEIVSARYAGTGGTINGFPKDVDFHPHHVNLSGGKLTAQLTYSNSSTMTRCVKIELWQSGTDVVCRAVYAAYIESADEDNDFDKYAKSRNWRMATKESVALHVANNNTRFNGYGFDTLVLRTKTAGVMFLVNGTMNVPAVAGNDVAVTFRAASATATVNVKTANTMTDSAYIIIGDADHVMKFYAQHSASPYYPLPAGMTDVYGEGTELHIYGYNKMGNGTSDGDAEITMHPGTVLYADNNTHAFKRSKQVVTLDAANFTANKTTYVPKDMTMANASTVFGTATLSAVYDTDQTLRVTGVGSGIFEANVTLYGKDVSKRWTIDVEDTVVDGVDFTMNGNITPDSSHNKAAIVKTGSGTMLMNGTMSYTVSPTEIVAGELRLGKSGATVADSSFSLQGGTLGLAAGAANTVGNVTLTASSAITVGNGATLIMASLTVPDGATLALTGDVLGKVKVSETLDADTLSRVTVNGKRAYQAADGYFRLRGLIISFH